MKYRKEIDGLRALAVIPVIMFHAGFSLFGGGFAGVDIFFVISGYLITSLIEPEVNSGSFSLVRFYERRARRILPALFLVLLCTLPFAWWLMLASDMIDFSKQLIGVAMFVPNVVLWRQSDYFATVAELKPLLHTWSLGVEEQYYLFFPLALMLIARLGRRWLAVLLLAVAFLSLAVAQQTARTHPAFAFFLLPSRAWELVTGALCALYLPASLRQPAHDRHTAVLRECGALAGLTMILIAVFLFGKETPFPGLWALVPTVGAAMIIAFASPGTAVGRLLGSRALVGIGLVSYSAYLWHQPIFAFLRLAGDDLDSVALRVSLIILTFALAAVSWKFVEAPFRQVRLVDRRTIFKLAFAGSGCLVLIGLGGIATNGFLFRFPPADRQLAAMGYNNRTYVETRFVERTLKDFDASGRRKIFLVGDSYGEDLVNAVAEGGLGQTLQISTRHIDLHCGNLYLPLAQIKPHINPVDLAACENKGWYEGAQTEKLLAQADEIWLASYWQDWQGQLIAQSVKHLQARFGHPVLVFGAKNFGEYRIRNLLRDSPQQRVKFTSQPLPQVMATNAAMKATLGPNVFVDVQQMLCGGYSLCHPFDTQGNLLSYDGAHLTKPGAVLYGQRLREDPRFVSQVPSSSGSGETQAVFERADTGISVRR
jgi:peptidoglycan/LPS O-acetylase OafA/YrhL